MSQASKIAKNNVQHLSGTTFGNLNLSKPYISITTTGAATASLPSGYDGQEIYIVLAVDGGDLVVSGSFETGATATFADAKDSVKFVWISGLGWAITSNQGAVSFL